MSRRGWERNQDDERATHTTAPNFKQCIRHAQVNKLPNLHTAERRQEHGGLSDALSARDLILVYGDARGDTKCDAVVGDILILGHVEPRTHERESCAPSIACTCSFERS